MIFLNIFAKFFGEKIGVFEQVGEKMKMTGFPSVSGRHCFVCSALPEFFS
jgi:hypothetical protein